VHSDPLDGVVYEIARRTTVAQHVDPNSIYRALFDSLPEGRRYERVLDWGTGHGAALIEWQRRHPESECHGVDLSAPCLKLANLRGREAGMTLHLSQQDFEHLDYPDGHFDLVFHMFMLHEIPPARHPAVLAEVHRVLKPGGLFAGAEFHLEAGDPFQNAIQRSHAWLNNETYSVPWYDVDYGGLAKEVGFSNVDIRPITALIGSLKRPRARGRTTWNTYIFEK
jgi:SAM-dependent methyltransferase